MWKNMEFKNVTHPNSNHFFIFPDNRFSGARINVHDFATEKSSPGVELSIESLMKQFKLTV